MIWILLVELQSVFQTSAGRLGVKQILAGILKWAGFSDNVER